MRILLCGLLLLACSSPALAQPTEPPLRGELARASFLVGRWEGTGWVRYQAGGDRVDARVTAEGKPVLSGLRLAWKSVASREGDRSAAVVMENDMGLRFRRDSSAFQVSVTIPGHSLADGWARVSQCELAWGYQMPDVPDGDWFRFAIRVDAENRATEVGERSSDGGATWWQFYGAETTGPAGGGCRASPAAADGAGSTQVEESQ